MYGGKKGREAIETLGFYREGTKAIPGPMWEHLHMCAHVQVFALEVDAMCEYVARVHRR